MANDTGRSKTDPATVSQPFDWDEFNGILDGLNPSLTNAVDADVSAEEKAQTDDSGVSHQFASANTAIRRPGTTGPFGQRPGSGRPQRYGPI